MKGRGGGGGGGSVYPSCERSGLFCCLHFPLEDRPRGSEARCTLLRTYALLPGTILLVGWSQHLRERSEKRSFNLSHLENLLLLEQGCIVGKDSLEAGLLELLRKQLVLDTILYAGFYRNLHLEICWDEPALHSLAEAPAKLFEQLNLESFQNSPEETLYRPDSTEDH